MSVGEVHPAPEQLLNLPVLRELKAIGTSDRVHWEDLSTHPQTCIGIRPTCTAGGLSGGMCGCQAAIARRTAFQFQGSSSAMRLAG
jgi:hypothetical protein